MCLAVPGQIQSIAAQECAAPEEALYRKGKVDFGGVVKEVSLACVPEAVVGDYVLVHVGMALSVIDEEEAHKVFACLNEIEQLSESTS